MMKIASVAKAAASPGGRTVSDYSISWPKLAATTRSLMSVLLPGSMVGVLPCTGRVRLT